MLKTSLCDYSDAYILVKGTIAVLNIAEAGEDANNTDKKVIFKNCTPFTSCIRRINITQTDYAQYVVVVMSMYSVIECSDNYLKTSGILWKYCRDLPADNESAVTNFAEVNVTHSFNLKVKLTGQMDNNGTKNVEITATLKYLSNFWRTLEMPLINCEITLDLNWPRCVILATNIANQSATFSITDTKLYVPAVTLSTQNNPKLLQRLKFAFKRTINWNKYQKSKYQQKDKINI